MSIAIPANFDYLKEKLDYNERVVRDVFRLNVENWAKFRYTIAVGTRTSRLSGMCGSSITDDAKDAYLNLGKCHYEVVCSLGYCTKAVYDVYTENQFVVGKAIKEFYFHAGALLDNLARLVFIINIPSGHSEKNKKGVYLRHSIDRGQLLSKYKQHINSYVPLLKSPLIEELVNVRNAMTHYWKIPLEDGKWPRGELKSTKAFAWPYDEAQFHEYEDWQPVPDIIKEHWQEIERVQNDVFGLLIADIPKFEQSISATIG